MTTGVKMVNEDGILHCCATTVGVVFSGDTVAVVLVRIALYCCSEGLTFT